MEVQEKLSGMKITVEHKGVTGSDGLADQKVIPLM